MTISHQQVPNWIRNFNPLLDQDSSRWPTQGGIYEPMLIYNTATSEIVPWLATAWEFSDDTKTHHLHPARGRHVVGRRAVYQRGRQVHLRLHDRATRVWPAPRASAACCRSIESVEAPDDKTVVITFKQVFTPALYDVGEQMIVPEHIWKDVEDPVTFLNENPVGTGPFTGIGAFQPQYYEILKNPNYWQEGKPFIDGFRAPLYPNNDSANLALVSGEIDRPPTSCPTSRTPTSPRIRSTSTTGSRPSARPSTSTPTRPRRPSTMPTCARRISMGIDRDQIVKVAMYDYTHPADGTGLSDAYDSWRNADAVAAGTWVHDGRRQGERDARRRRSGR